jgi:hypothetical protein
VPSASPQLDLRAIRDLVLLVGLRDVVRERLALANGTRKCRSGFPVFTHSKTLHEAGGGRLNNWRRRDWAPAVEASGIALPARIYDLRATFASDALAANVSVFRLARVMGTSVRMIERHYGALLDGAGADIADRLDALDLERDRAATERADDANEV